VTDRGAGRRAGAAGGGGSRGWGGGGVARCMTLGQHEEGCTAAILGAMRCKSGGRSAPTLHPIAGRNARYPGGDHAIFVALAWLVVADQNKTMNHERGWSPRMGAGEPIPWCP